MMPSNQNITVRILKNDLGRLARATPDSADRALRAIVQHGESHARMIMTESPASGLTYQRGKKTHTASSPGNPPRVDTGNLRGSIRNEPRGTLAYAVVAGGLNEVNYAHHLEFGAEENGLAARPFMGPTAREMESVISEMFDQFLEKA